MTSFFDLLTFYGPVAYWRLGETADTVVTDILATQTGVYQRGVTLGQRGALPTDADPAAQFDGIDDYVEIAHNTAFATPSGSLQFWFNPDRVTGRQGLLSKDASGFGTGGHLGILLDEGRLWVRSQTTTGTYQYFSNPVINVGTWQQVVVTWGSEGVVTYLNGVQVGANPAWTQGLAENQQPLVLGANQWQSSPGVADDVRDFFAGRLDEVAVFDRPLDATAVQNLYNAGVTYFDLITFYDPIAYWRLDETTGTTVVDTVGTQDGEYKQGVVLGETGAIVADSSTAVQFDGVNDYVEIPHNPAFLIPSGSLQFWFNPDRVDQVHGLFTKDSANFDDGGHLSILVDQGRLRVRSQTTSASLEYFSAPVITVGNWYQVVVTWGTQGLVVYLDGQAVAINPEWTQGLVGNREPIVLGSNQWTSGDLVADILIDFYAGRLDEVALFGRALAATEVKRLYDVGRTEPFTLPPPPNTAPLASNDGFVTDEETPLVVDVATGLLSGDMDAEGDALTAILVTDAIHGTVILNPDGSFLYTPDGDFNGLDSFTYKANDGQADSNLATVWVTVNAVNDAPIANVDTLTVVAGSSLVFSAAELLGNDTDVDGPVLKVTAIAQPSQGRLTNLGNGTYSYQPTAGFEGTDTFTYTINDGLDGTATGTIQMTVTAPPNDLDFAFIPGDRQPFTFNLPLLSAVGLDVSSLDQNDIRVTGPNGFNQRARFLAVSDYTDGVRAVTYEVLPADGTWDANDVGTYYIWIQPNQIFDVNGQAITPGLQDVVNVGQHQPPSVPIGDDDLINQPTVLVGNLHSNTLEGGAGAQILTGNGGRDRYIYRTLADGEDLITDFDPDDRLHIVAAGFGGGLQAGYALSQTASGGTWLSGSNPSPTTGQATFLYHTDTGLVSYDPDGIGPQGAIGLAQLNGAPTLQAHQIEFI